MKKNNGLPERWAARSLGEIGKYINGRAFKPKEWKTQGKPIIRIQNLNNPDIKFNYSDKEHENKYLVKKGDLLVAWSASLGVFIWNGDDAWLNQHIFKVEPKGKIVTKEYLYFAIKQAIGELYRKAHGTGMVHVTKPVFESHEIPVAPIEEQRRITKKMKDLDRRIMRCQERLDNVSTALKRYRQSVLHNFFVHNWDEVTVGEVIEDIRYGTSRKCSKEKKKHVVLRIPNVAKGRIVLEDLKYADLNDKEYEKLKLIEGDILIIRSNGSVSLVGRSAIVSEKEADMAYAGYLIRIRVKAEVMDADFLNLQLQSQDVRDQIEIPIRSTSGVNNINSEEVKNLRIVKPPLAEQIKFVSRCRMLFETIETIEKRYLTASQHVDRLSQCFLAKALRGELTEQDSINMPAASV